MEIPDILVQAAKNNFVNPKCLALFILENIDESLANESARFLKKTLDENQKIGDYHRHAKSASPR